MHNIVNSFPSVTLGTLLQKLNGCMILKRGKRRFCAILAACAARLIRARDCEKTVESWLKLVFYSAAAFAFIMAVLPHPPRLPGDPPDKVLHVLAFLALGGLAAVAFPRRSILWLTVALAIFGAAIELIQTIPALHRDSEIADLAADVVAALLAVWSIRVLALRNSK